MTCNIAIPAGLGSLFGTTSHHVPACRQIHIQTAHLTWISHQLLQNHQGKRGIKSSPLIGDSCHRALHLNTAQWIAVLSYSQSSLHSQARWQNGSLPSDYTSM